MDARHVTAFIISTLLMVPLVLGAGCGRHSAAALSKVDERKLFTLEANPVELALGEAGALVVEIEAGKGWQWNDEFPVRLALGDVERPGLSFKKSALVRGDEEIQVAATRATMSLPVKAEAPGEYMVPLTISFSVCDEKRCHIFRNREVKIELKVRREE